MSVSNLIWKCLVVLGAIWLPALAFAYDGNDDVVEGWTYHVCNLAELGRDKLPVYECGEPDCYVFGELEEGRLVFAFPTDEKKPRWEALPVDKFVVFWNFTENALPWGYVDHKYLCDTAVPK